jgi:hypothetical protein
MAVFNVIHQGEFSHNSEYLGSVGESIVADLNKELWGRDDLAIPVYHTGDGRFINIFVLFPIFLSRT